MRKEVQVTASSLNVRKGPGANNSVVSSLSKGQKVIVCAEKKLSDKSVWWQIESSKNWACYKTSAGAYYMKVVKDLEGSGDSFKPAQDHSWGYSDGLDNKVMDMLYKTSRKYDALDVSTRLFGSPHQFLPTTDLRVNTKIDLGRKFIENIVAESPIVYFMPGRANFLPNTSKQRKKILGDFFSKHQPSDSTAKEALKDIIDGSENERFFDFVNDHSTYMKHVNILCRMCSIYLGIGDWTAPGTTTKYQYYNWENYKYFNLTKQKEPTNKSVFSKLAKKVSVDVEEILFGRGLHIPFYVEPTTSFNESASNNTKTSILESTIGNAEGIAKDISFMLQAGAFGQADSFIKEITDKVTDVISGFTSDNGAMQRIVGTANTIIDGGNMIFPEMWADSSYNKSYSVNINLITPYGDKESIYLNILVPMMHLIALALPSQIDSNAYGPPMLVKAFSKGWFSCDMGMIGSISIEKGTGGAWSVDGLPLNAKVSIDIKDLYTELSVPRSDKPSNFMNNQSMIDFLAVSCGVDITEPTILLKIKTIWATFTNKLFDMPNNWYNEFLEELRTILDPLIRI